MKNKQLHIRSAIGILLLIFSQATFAQLIKQKTSYVVYINYPDYTVKTSVYNSNKKFNVNESLTYYWYAANKILQTKGNYDGKLVDGAYTSFYLSNNLKEKGNFKKGLKSGKWISWYENGKINEISNWRNGKKCGTYKKFNPDESLSLTSTYKNDQLNGIQTTYLDGEIADQVKYRKGKEVIKKQKQQTDSTEQKHATPFKEKIAAVFKKKKKEEVTTEKKATEKKTLKERWNTLFKKKEKKTEPAILKPETTEGANPPGSKAEVPKKSKKKTGT